MAETKTVFLFGASLVAQTVKHLPAMLETWVQSLGGKESLEKEMATHSSILAWEIPWTEEPGRLVHGVAESRIRLYRQGYQRLKRLPGMRETRVRSLGQEKPLEKERATHSSTLAWRLPWREEPSRLQSMGSQRVRHD